MKNLILFFALSFILSSCAHSKDWGPWVVKNVPSENQEWRRCTKLLDGEERHHKGECYTLQECRTRKTILGNERKECRPYRLFCGWGDIECMYKHNTFNSVIINKGNL